MSPMTSRPLTIELALLGYLQQVSLHGYQIHQRLLEPDGLGQVWRLKQAQLYALLEKLEEAGFIQGTLQAQETRPARRVFHLTPTGQEMLQAWLFSPVTRPRQMRQEFQAKLYFAQIQGHAACARLIAVQRQACQKWLAEQKISAQQESASGAYVWLVDQYRVGQIQAMLDWLDVCQEKLGHPDKPSA